MFKILLSRVYAVDFLCSGDEQGHYFLNIATHPTQPLPSNKLVMRIAETLQLAKQQHHQLPVYIKGDQRINFGKVVQIMALLQQAGAGTVGLITENPNVPPLPA